MKSHILLVAASLLVTSCAHMTYRNTRGVPISFTGNLGLDKEHKVVRHVDDDYRRKWLLFYLIPIGDDGSDMIAQSVGNADGMANLRITAQWDVLDVLITNITSGIFCTRSVNIQGDLVKFVDKSGAKKEAALKCPKCGFENATGATFCIKCGTGLAAQPPP